MDHPPIDLTEFLQELPSKEPGPHHAVAKRHTVQWAVESGIVLSEAAVTHLELTDTAFCSVGLHPMKMTEKQACDLADMYTALFVFDDYIDEGPDKANPDCVGKIVDDISRGLVQGVTATETPIAAAVADAFSRVTYGYPLVRRRCLMGFLNYLQGVQREAVDRANDLRHDLQTHIDRRRACSAVLPYMGLNQPCLNIELPDWVHAIPEFQRVADACVDVSHWTSDLVSVHREGDQETHNLLNRIQEETGASPSMAWERIIRMIHHRIKFLDEEIVQLQRVQEITQCDELLITQTRHVAEAMRDWATGSIHWFQSSIRYRTPATGRDTDFEEYRNLPFQESSVFQSNLPRDRPQARADGSIPARDTFPRSRLQNKLLSRVESRLVEVDLRVRDAGASQRLELPLQ